jgi:hypothetical protein
VLQFVTFALIFLAFSNDCIVGIDGSFAHALWMSSRTASTLGFNQIYPEVTCVGPNLVVMIQVKVGWCAWWYMQIYRRQEEADQAQQRHARTPVAAAAAGRRESFGLLPYMQAGAGAAATVGVPTSSRCWVI